MDRQIKFLLARVGVMLALAGTTAIATPCLEAAREVYAEGHPFSPEKILRAHEVNPDLMTFRVEQTDNSFALMVSYSGKIAGYLMIIETEDLNGRPYATIQDVKVYPELRGKGLGSLLYLAGARLVHDTLGWDLMRSENTSPDAKALWSRMVTAGFAKSSHDELGLEDVRMRRTIISSSVGSEALEFVRSHGHK